MSNVNIFQDPTKALSKKDEQIVRIDMEQSEIGARASHIPSNIKSDKLAIRHVPNASSRH